jgi:amidohydrolase
MSTFSSSIEHLIQLRKKLHQHPELSGSEKSTAAIIRSFLEEADPSAIITGLGGHGLAVVFDSGKPGPALLLRADLDALPIEEKNSFDHRSVAEGVAHLCGHDGHSAILAGVGLRLREEPPESGKVVLLFQPSEETGEGAEKVINDPAFEAVRPDYAFAMHNLPGVKRGTVCVREGSFASASTGLVVKLTGKTSHAAHPENGNNPDRAMATIIMGLNEIANQKHLFTQYTLATVIHARLGEVAFGTTPGKGVVMATLRAATDRDLDTLKQEAVTLITKSCTTYDLGFDITWPEPFPATINNNECTKTIALAAKELNMPVVSPDHPFRWSEDFGHFTQVTKAALFGIGAGTNHPQLHSEMYDFPDEIIEPAVNLFLNITKAILR